MKFGLIQLMNGIIRIGNGTNTANKQVQAYNGDANPPSFRYNESLNRWEFSNDGTNFFAFGYSNDSRWTEISGCFTATPASTSTLTMTSDQTAILKVGMPVRYTISAVIYYGIITASASNLLTIAGAPMGGDVTKLEYGFPEMVVQVDLFVSGNYGDGTTTTLLFTDMKTKFLWRIGKAYCVAVHGLQETVASTNQPKVNLLVNAARVSTNDTNLGLTMSTSGTLVNNVAVAINTTNYDINKGEALEIEVTSAGTGAATGSNLTIEAVFVME